MFNRLLIVLAILWALPWTLVGLLLGSIGLITGGRVQRVGRTLEFSGGRLARLLEHGPVRGGAAAVTFDHVVLGQTRADLRRCRAHELVHVRQYERWGVHQRRSISGSA